jgi:hypothetical protein
MPGLRSECAICSSGNEQVKPHVVDMVRMHTGELSTCFWMMHYSGITKSIFELCAGEYEVTLRSEPTVSQPHSLQLSL